MCPCRVGTDTDRTRAPMKIFSLHHNRTAVCKPDMSKHLKATDRMRAPMKVFSLHRNRTAVCKPVMSKHLKAKATVKRLLKYNIGW